MLELIKKWLGGQREFFTGRAIYRKLEKKNSALLSLFSEGPTPYSIQKLVDAMKHACVELEAIQSSSPEHTGVSVRNVSLKTEPPPAPATELNLPLYLAAKIEADNAYKVVMNDRALLFRMAAYDGFSDPNFPDLIEARRKLAIAVVTGFQETSAQYDKADYIRENNKLPDETPTLRNEYDDVADHLVKQTLDNLRKNYNKTLKKQQTPERVAKQQLQLENIKKLEARWLLLKQQ